MASMRATYGIGLMAMALVACDAADEDGVDSSSADVTESDSLKRPTDHGALTFDHEVSAVIGAKARNHAWTFEVADGASITLQTGEHGGDEVDTVLYLYKQGPKGWGSYVARNDDESDDSWYSRIDEELSAGTYRAVVRGVDRDEVGPASDRLIQHEGLTRGGSVYLVPWSGEVRVALQSNRVGADTQDECSGWTEGLAKADLVADALAARTTLVDVRAASTCHAGSAPTMGFDATFSATYEAHVGKTCAKLVAKRDENVETLADGAWSKKQRAVVIDVRY